MPSDLILGESSETVQAHRFKKRKRGRPKVISDFMEEHFYKPYVYSDSVKTRRGHLNEHYRFQALSALIVGEEDECIDPQSAGFEFKWLYDDVNSHKNPRAYRKTILAELGRLQDPSLIRTVAREVCAIRPTAKDAIVMIRRHRVRQLSAPTVEREDAQLAKELVDAVLNYLRRYPGTPFSDIYTALNYVHIIMRTAEGLPN
jgi:hypothetical protein